MAVGRNLFGLSAQAKARLIEKLSSAAATLLIVLRMYVFAYTLRAPTIPPNQALIRHASIAIWRSNQVITAVAIVVWGINVVFLIRGKSFPLLLLSDDLL